MAMYATYGTYTHELNECEVVSHTIGQPGPTSPRGGRTIDEETLIVRGMLHADSAEELTAAMLLMRAAYSVDGYDFILRHDDGTATHHSIYSSGTLDGTRVSLSWGGASGAEYTTYRSYQITVRAERILPDGLFAWQETVVTIGNGGPGFVVRDAIFGSPIKQWTSERTSCRARQSGSAVGWATWPQGAPPPPIWAEHLRSQSVFEARSTPDVHRLGYTKWPVQWSYEFESPEPFGPPIPTVR